MITKKFERILRLFRKPVITKANITYLQPNGRLNGKKIVITGGGRGLGAAMAKRFVNEGASVLIAGRNLDTIKMTAEEIGCKCLPLDVSQVELFEKFIEDACQILGGVDVLVNNAGISLHEKTFFDVTSESFDLQMNTNLKGPFLLAQSLIKKWKENNTSGSILFVSSETGEMSDYRPYGFTKAAINSMVQGMAYLFAKDGIRVNAVAPGVTCSDMTGRKSDDLTLKSNMLGRLYLPEEVAETACFLISDAAGCVSGQIITCNNGKTINARWKK